MYIHARLSVYADCTIKCNNFRRSNIISLNNFIWILHEQYSNLHLSKFFLDLLWNFHLEINYYFTRFIKICKKFNQLEY